MKKRQNFLLLELLVALALVGIVGSQLLRPSYQFAKQQRKQMELMQLGRFSKEALLHVKMALLSKSIRLPLDGEQIRGELEPLSLLSSSGEGQSYQCRYLLKPKRRSQREGKRRGHLYSLELTFAYKNSIREKFTYPLFIEEIEQ